MDKNIFLAKNPWKMGRLPAPPALTRPIYEELLELSQERAVLLVFGPRRAGAVRIT